MFLVFAHPLKLMWTSQVEVEYERIASVCNNKKSTALLSSDIPKNRENADRLTDSIF